MTEVCHLMPPKYSQTTPWNCFSLTSKSPSWSRYTLCGENADTHADLHPSCLGLHWRKQMSTGRNQQINFAWWPKPDVDRSLRGKKEQEERYGLSPLCHNPFCFFQDYLSAIDLKTVLYPKRLWNRVPTLSGLNTSECGYHLSWKACLIISNAPNSSWARQYII